MLTNQIAQCLCISGHIRLQDFRLPNSNCMAHVIAAPEAARVLISHTKYMMFNSVINPGALGYATSCVVYTPDQWYKVLNICYSVLLNMLTINVH